MSEYGESQSYLIVYAIRDDHAAILRLLGGGRDWISVLKAADL